MIGFLHFPPHDQIKSYLERHSSTNDPSYKERGLIEAVASVFADRDHASNSLSFSVKVTLMDLSDRIKISDEEILAISVNLTQALKDCAEGKEIKVEKK